MSEQDQVYQLPESTGEDIRKMMVWLAWFFGIATILAIIFIIYAPVFLKWVPFSVEKNFVRPYEEVVARWWDGNEHPEIDAYLQKLSDDLEIALELPAEIVIQTHYIGSDEINAFAVLGGHVFVTRGLLNAVDSENALAMVVAHELAHQKNRDPITGLSRGIAVMMIYSLVTNDYAQLDLSGIGPELGLTYFSRDQEQKADVAAIEALNRHYGHVGGYDQFFNAVIAEEESNELSQPEWLSTHPDTVARIEGLEDLKDRNGWELGPTHPIPDFILQLIEHEPRE